jgi:predicted DNA-binding mobile mystery protein A
MADRMVRRQLDARFSQMGSRQIFASPPNGWIRAIRRSLGMTAAQLARRLGRTPQAVLELERSEARGAITLKSLTNAARALDCTFVYALIPNRSLDEMVRERARQVAAERIQNLEQTMRLENQALPLEQREAQIDDLADDLVRRDIRALWRDPA